MYKPNRGGLVAKLTRFCLFEAINPYLLRQVYIHKYKISLKTHTHTKYIQHQSSLKMETKREKQDNGEEEFFPGDLL